MLRFREVGGKIDQGLVFKGKRGRQELLTRFRGNSEGFPDEGERIADGEGGGSENRSRGFGKDLLLEDGADQRRGTMQKDRMLVDFVPVDQ